MRARAVGILMLGFLLMGSGCAGGRGRMAGGWTPLGTRTVQGRADADVIHVGRSDGRFHQLQFVVRGGGLEMYDVKVVFGDGETWSPPTRLAFESNDWSRVIDLPGAGRMIRRVEFRYGNLQAAHARLRLFGR